DDDAPATVIYDAANNTLLVVGTGADENILITTPSTYSIRIDDNGMVTTVTNRAINTKTVVLVFGGAGNDTITNTTALPPTNGALSSMLVGGTGNDVLRGGGSTDILVGGEFTGTSTPHTGSSYTNAVLFDILKLYAGQNSPNPVGTRDTDLFPDVPNGI